MELHERLESIRKQQGYSRKDLAEYLGTSVRAIDYYATGQRSPDHRILIKLADLFDCSIDYLVGRSDNPKRC